MSLLTKRAIADAVINAMLADEDHDAIKLFIRGWAPLPVPIELHPYYEVVVMGLSELTGETGDVYDHQYAGSIRANVQAVGAGRDWLTPIDNRVLHVPTYDRVEEYLAATSLLLLQPEYRSLNNLRVVDNTRGAVEAVLSFTLGPQELGSSREERGDNFSNYGTISFEVITEATY